MMEPTPEAIEGKPTVAQQAWAIVNNAGPEWWNWYSRKHPDSAADEHTQRREMAHYCVAAAIKESARRVAEKDAEIAHARKDRDAYRASYAEACLERDAALEEIAALRAQVETFAKVIVLGDGHFTGAEWEAALCAAERICPRDTIPSKGDADHG